MRVGIAGNLHEKRGSRVLYEGHVDVEVVENFHGDGIVWGGSGVQAALALRDREFIYADETLAILFRVAAGNHPPAGLPVCAEMLAHGLP